MQKLQCLLFVLKRSYVCYYVLCDLHGSTFKPEKKKIHNAYNKKNPSIPHIIEILFYTPVWGLFFKLLNGRSEGSK